MEGDSLRDVDCDAGLDDAGIGEAGLGEVGRGLEANDERGDVARDRSGLAYEKKISPPWPAAMGPCFSFRNEFL